MVNVSMYYLQRYTTSKGREPEARSLRPEPSQFSLKWIISVPAHYQPQEGPDRARGPLNSSEEVPASKMPQKYALETF